MVEVRSFIRQSVAISDAALRESLLRELCGFAHGLKARLREEDERQAAHPWLAESAEAYGLNLCDGILRRVGRQCSELANRGEISEWRYTNLETRLSGLSAAQATCERIKGTPLPFPYTLLLHRTIYLFCLLLPFALAHSLGWLAPILTTMVAYTFFGLDAIGDQLEDPFGHDENDLALEALVRTLEREILDALGQRDLPPALEPVDYVLN
ncbi:Bestrophin, RFP-TM, chloride channel [compost metagenome]